MLSAFGLGWDPEPSVREIWKGVLSARRERRWAEEYVGSILAAAAGDNQSILKSYRYGQALSKIGDDESARRIEAILSTQTLRPNARHWLTKVLGEIKKNWKKVTNKWPEPWSHEQGTIEELDGVIVLGNGTRVNAKLSLWCHCSGPSDLGEWGGVAEDLEGKFPFPFEEEQIEIRVPGRSPARARVFGSHWSSSSTDRLVVRGNSPYPAKPHPQQMNLVDIVSEIIRETGVNVATEDVEDISRRLQLLLKRAGLSLLSLPPEYDAGLRLKLACQEAALVTRAIAESVPPTFLSSVALWRIANSILEGESLALRLSPAELVTFGATARLGDRNTPDDLLFWMMDRVESQQPNDAIRIATRQEPNDAKPRADVTLASVDLFEVNALSSLKRSILATSSCPVSNWSRQDSRRNLGNEFQTAINFG